MEEFDVKIELGFVWVGGAVSLFFEPCSLSSHNLTLRPLN